MEKGVHSGPARLVWVVLLIVVALAVVAGGYAYYRYETERIRQKKYEDIAAIGELKAGQIRQWRQERLGDVRRSSKAPFFGQAIREWLRDLNNSSLLAQLQDRLALEQKEEGYADVLLLDPECRVLLSAEPQSHPLSPAAKQVIEQALANRTPMLSDLYRCPQGMVHLDAVAPILDRDGRPVAVLVLRSNAQSYLYPLIQSWPTPSRTAETLLVRKEGEDLLFLNDLRHRPATALSLREPLTRHDLPAVQAVLGKQGIFQGRDYRGVEVLADLRPIPQSPWFMVAKVDASEILEEARYRGGVIALFSALFILLAAGVTAYAYSHRQVRLYQELYRSERETQEEFRTTLYSIGDAVITTDTKGLVKQMNPVAERVTGWLETEATRKPIEEVFHIVNEETRGVVENPVQRVLREGVVVGLANHTLLISKDGTEHPIASSGAPIRDERGAIVGVVLVFRDQTEERAAQKTLQESEERFRRVSSITSDVAYSCNKSTEGAYSIDWISGATESITGYSEVEIKALGCWHPLVVDDDVPLFEDHVIGLAPGTTASCELRLRHKNGAIVWVASFAECRVDSESPDNLRLYGGLIDITERKRTEAALRTSEAQLSNSLTMAHLGHWEYEIKQDLFTFNDHFYKIFRTTAEQVGGYTMSSAEYARRFVHPDDMHVVADEIRKSLESTDPHYSRQLEHRMLYADGEVGYITVRFIVVRDDLGRTIKTYGVNQDITERKRAEEALRGSEARYRSLFENMLEGFAYCQMLFDDGEPLDFREPLLITAATWDFPKYFVSA